MADASKKNFNAAIEAWALLATTKMVRNINSKQLVRTGNFGRKLTFNTKMGGDAEVRQISWKAPRYGFVLAHVGKKFTHQLDSGARRTIATGKEDSKGRKIVRYDTRTLTKRGANGDWFFNLLDQEVPNLADIVSELHSNRAVSASAILATAKGIRKR